MVSHHRHSTIAPMEGLRGFAAFMVFFVHYSAQSVPWVSENSFTSELIFNLRFLGATGVDLFFILSGFLIYGMLIKRNLSYSIYAKRRIKRIYPTFLALMCLYLLLSFIFPSESKLPENWQEATVYVIQCLLLLPGLFDIEPMMTVAWTLSYEMFFYLLVPILIALTNLRAINPHHRILFLAAVTVTGFLISLEYSAHIRMLMFISGMLLFEIKENTNWSLSSKFTQAHFVLPVTFLLMLTIRHSFFDDYIWGVVLVMFIGYGLACFDVFKGESLLGKLFMTNYLRWYGNMSYSYYLVHGLTLKFLFLVTAYLFKPEGDTDWIFYAMIIPFFAITLVVSALLFVLVEKRFSLK